MDQIKVLSVFNAAVTSHQNRMAEKEVTEWEIGVETALTIMVKLSSDKAD